MTSPFSFSTGPPEFPWVVLAFVCRMGAPSAAVFLAEM